MLVALHTILFVQCQKRRVFVDYRQWPEPVKFTLTNLYEGFTMINLYFFLLLTIALPLQAGFLDIFIKSSDEIAQTFGDDTQRKTTTMQGGIKSQDFHTLNTGSGSFNVTIINTQEKEPQPSITHTEESKNYNNPKKAKPIEQTEPSETFSSTRSKHSTLRRIGYTAGLSYASLQSYLWYLSTKLTKNNSWSGWALVTFPEGITTMSQSFVKARLLQYLKETSGKTISCFLDEIDSEIAYLKRYQTIAEYLSFARILFFNTTLLYEIPLRLKRVEFLRAAAST